MCDESFSINCSAEIPEDVDKGWFMFFVTLLNQFYWVASATIGLCVLGTMATRFLPFLIFREDKETPAFVQYLGKYLAASVFEMLVIYCLRNVSFLHGNHGIPEMIAIVVTCRLHLWKRQMLVSIAGRTACYMLLLHFVFI